MSHSLYADVGYVLVCYVFGIAAAALLYVVKHFGQRVHRAIIGTPRQQGVKLLYRHLKVPRAHHHVFRVFRPYYH